MPKQSANYDRAAEISLIDLGRKPLLKLESIATFLKRSPHRTPALLPVGGTKRVADEDAIAKVASRQSSSVRRLVNAKNRILFGNCLNFPNLLKVLYPTTRASGIWDISNVE